MKESSFQELFVNVMAADPKPSQAFRSFFGQRAMPQSNANGPKDADILEPKRRMARV
ncbi:MAG TPA: hypothetical protein VN765_06885 [Candidatus Acidoferrum sp.]|nr:hypothetical protein [Candidatus Acidoferrum sp.]